jgi:hypothetical protein
VLAGLRSHGALVAQGSLRRKLALLAPIDFAGVFSLRSACAFRNHTVVVEHWFAICAMLAQGVAQALESLREFILILRAKRTGS